MSDTKSWLDAQIDSPKMARLDAEEGLILSACEQLLRSLREAEVSKSEIAKRIGVSPAHITQTLNGSRNMTLRTFAAIAWAVGHRVDLKVVPSERMDVECNIEVHDRPIAAKFTSGVRSGGRRAVEEAEDGESSGDMAAAA